MKFVYILLPLLICISIQSFGQTPNPCGTTEGRSTWLKDFQAGKYPVNRNSGEWLIAPIYVHITGEDNGSDYTSRVLVGESIKILNEAFEQAEIQFFLIDDYHYIANSEYHNHESFGMGRSMMNEHNVSGAINIYICADAAGNCGYYTGGPDAIAINNDCLDPVNQTWAHEMGHLLSLPHPFVGWEGTNYDDSNSTPISMGGRQVEKTDGSNCQDASDGFCGTPPDYLSYRWTCNDDGESNLIQYDPDGIPFQSDGSIIMSYSTGSCRNKFSEDQIDAMCSNIINTRSNILNHDREYKPLSPCGKVQLLAPAQRDSIQYDAGNLIWKQVPYADFYHLRVSRNINFTDLIVDQQMEYQDTTYQLDPLDLGRNYFWQVDGYAAHSPCVQISQKKWFFTYDFSQTISLDNEQGISTYFGANDLKIKTENFELNNASIFLYDLSGKQVLQYRTNSAVSDVTIFLPELQTGIYLVRILAEDVNVVAKLFK